MVTYSQCLWVIFSLIIASGAFDDDDVTHVEGEVNPVRDLEIIMDELRLKDMEYVETNLEKLERTVVRGNDKKLKPEYVSLTHYFVYYIFLYNFWINIFCNI